jgi:hypothetical protein
MSKHQVSWKGKIEGLYPCYDGLQWLDKQKSYQQAWKDCPRTDWLIWLIENSIRNESDHKRFMLLLCNMIKCAKETNYRKRAIFTSDLFDLMSILEQWAAGDTEYTIDNLYTAISNITDTDEFKYYNDPLFHDLLMSLRLPYSGSDMLFLLDNSWYTGTHNRRSSI